MRTKPTAAFAKLKDLARPCGWMLARLLLLSILSVPLTLLGPVPMKLIVDNVLGDLPLPVGLAWLGSSTIAGVGLAVGLLVGTTILTYVHLMASQWLQTLTGERLVLAFRSRLFEHAQRLSLTYHDQAGSADALYRIQWDANAAQDVIIGAVGLLTPVATVLGMLVVTALIDWRLAVVAVLVCPVLYVATRMFRDRIVARWHEVRQVESQAMAVIQEVLTALRVVKAFGRERDERDRFVTHANTRLRGYLTLAGMQGRFDLQVGLIMALGSAAVLLIGIWRVEVGAMSVGSLLIVIAYTSQMYDPLKTMSKKVADLQAGLVSVERAFELLERSPEVHDAPASLTIRKARGSVSFRGVSFVYPNGHQALRDVSFDVAPGTCVGIAGESGAGKTTLLNLLMRLYDPSSGTILLDGVDIRAYRVADLRRQFALVLQDAVLFSTTIGENIRYGRPEATDAEIRQAARDANAHEFIMRLPDQYQTLVGERGMALSGGERQRVALARAFLRDAPILILDEPTSAVDAKTESAMLDTLERLMRGRTTLIVSHRPAALANCDAQLRIGARTVQIDEPEIVAPVPAFFDFDHLSAPEVIRVLHG